MPTRYPAHVSLVEVGPRDGLQNERALISTDDKVAFIDLLSNARPAVIEVSAFVSPKWVPQMADADDVLRRIQRAEGIRYSALVPNLQGLERARAAALTEVAIFGAASETFSQRNINKSIDQSFDVFAEVCREAEASGMRVRGYLSTSFGCPFEGDVPIMRVVTLTRRLLDLGVFEVALSDTIGVAHPGQVFEVLDQVLNRFEAQRIALHFHDTRGTALANVLAALECGITTFDASAGGLGGCPYAPGASGNLATEDLLYMLNGLEIQTGVSLPHVARASELIATRLDHPLPSRYLQAAHATASPAPAGRAQ